MLLYIGRYVPPHLRNSSSVDQGFTGPPGEGEGGRGGGGRGGGGEGERESGGKREGEVVGVRERKRGG